MLNKETLKNFLIDINFIEKGNVLERYFKTYDCYVRVDFNAETIIYPKAKRGYIISEQKLKKTVLSA